MTNVIDFASRRAVSQQAVDQNRLPLLTDEQRAQLDLAHEQLALRSGAALEEFINETLRISNGDLHRLLTEFVIACASNAAASIACTAQMAPDNAVTPLSLAEAVWDVNRKIMSEVPFTAADDDAGE